MKANLDTITFEITGRSAYANNTIIGLAVDLQGATQGQYNLAYYGYDGAIAMDDGDEPSNEEKRELALMMIRKWAVYGGLAAEDLVKEAVKLAYLSTTGGR